MILYHFCAAKHIKSILQQGLTKGVLAEPTPDGFRIYYGYTWLTVDPDPGKQSWATRNAIKYDRTAWRLTIEIPDAECSRLYDPLSITAHYPDCDLLFTGFPGSESWRVFRGRIPKEWIKEANRVRP